MNRTPDTRIFSPLLYQLSYLAFLICYVKNADFQSWPILSLCDPASLALIDSRLKPLLLMDFQS